MAANQAVGGAGRPDATHASGLPGRLRVLIVARERGAAARFGGAALAVLATAMAQLVLFASSAPWFLYTPTVVIVTLALGADAGVLATVLAAIGAGYAVVRPDAAILMMPVHWIASVIFVLTTLGLVGLVRALKIALREADALRAARDRDATLAAEREAFLSGVLSASTDCIKVLELDGSLSFMSEGGLKVMEIGDFNDVRGCPWPDFMRDAASAQAREALAAARQGRTSHFESDIDTYLGNSKHWSVSVSPITGADGTVARILSVSRDHTSLARAREQAQLLNGELAHRLKNTLGVVQAIAHQTLGRGGDLEAGLAAFGERLAALASAHDVLSAGSWARAEMADVVHKVLATFDDHGRVAVAGPALMLGPRATLSLSLLLHELATNATKYGAFSVPGGRVALDWQVDGASGDVRMTWAERGGPPAVEPTRRGFGSRIIRMGLTGAGGTTLRYGDEGLTVDLFASADQLRQA